MTERPTHNAVTTRSFVVAAFIVALLAITDTFLIGLVARQEFLLSDLLVRQQAQSNRPDSDIVVVDIDERSLEGMVAAAGRYPWPRSIHAELAEALVSRGARAVVFDILFTDPDQQNPGHDEYLIEVAEQHDNIYFPMLLLPTAKAGLDLNRWGETLGFRPIDPEPAAEQAMLLPLPGLAATGRIGTINFTEDDDGVGRRYRVRHHVDGWEILSLPAKVVADLGQSLPPNIHIRLNWQGGALSYARVSYVDLYHAVIGDTDDARLADFSDKIVVIGATASGLHDLRMTPIANLHPAVEMVATAIDNLMNDAYYRDVPRGLVLLLALVGIAWLSWGFVRGRGLTALGSVLLLVSVATLVIAYLALEARLVLPVVMPLAWMWIYFLSAAFHVYLSERRQRQRTTEIFGRFLDPRVVGELVRSGEADLSMRGETREITVLFSDIRGFTTLSEQRSAEEIVAILNRYFSRQVDVIFARGGTMDKFIGDAIMAFWGAPVDDSDQAPHAVAAALDMCEQLTLFQQEIGLDGFDIGIGIHTGTAVVGFIGSDNRLDYTAIGDTVNLASRIEGQTKGIARVLVSAETMHRCGDAFDFVDHGFYKVKGRDQEVRLYEPRKWEPRKSG